MSLWSSKKAIVALIWEIKCDRDRYVCPVWEAVPEVKYDYIFVKMLL